jgi:uncharacterized protein (DUF427 family)
MSDHVRVEPLGRRLRAVLGGVPIVETERALVVHEGGLPARYYVPREDVKAEISKGQGTGSCPWKGKWEHLDLEVGERTVANGAWSYFETTPVCSEIRGHVSFYVEKLDALEIDG